jgi:CHAT domain-containing protein
LTIQEQALGPAHAEVGWTVTLLGLLYAQGKPGRESEASRLFERSLAILEPALGPQHPRVASTLGGLGALAAAAGDQARAGREFARALAIQEKTLGPDHPDVAQTLESLAAVARAQGDPSRSLPLLSRSAEIRERHLARNLPLGSERQKLGYLRLFAQDIDRAVTLQAQLSPADPQALDLAFTTLLRRKGRALDAAGDNVADLRRRASPQDRDLFARLAGARSELAALTLQGAARLRPDVYRRQLRQLEDTVDRLEADVAARSAEFRAQSRPITIAAVRTAIPDGAALVEFATYRPDSGVAGRPAAARYAAFLLDPHASPAWIDLGEAAEIDRAAYAWRQAIGDPQRDDARRLARALDARVMQPVRARLGPSTHLLVSPDGALNLVPFAALVDEGGRYLVERFSITYLTSGRDLLRLEVPRESRSGPLVVAAPAFGEPALTTGESPRAGQPVRAQVDYSHVFFGPLPGVGDEVRALRDLLPEAAFLVGEQATEAAMRQVSGPRLLHVATHGFFLQSDDTGPAGAPATPAGPAGTRLGRWAAWAENPLLRSGLALAGANQGRSGTDDGVLTALEMASLDLWGTRLVVLSACDTGVGEVRNGDGVYGLRRALVLAGSESQLMSLWAVSDRGTRDLMAGYYARLARGDGRGEALRQVQLQILRNRQRAHPYYWAGFIQSGDWRPIDTGR